MKLPPVRRFFARFRTLRWRLTLFYCGLLAVLLSAAGFFVYARFAEVQHDNAVSRLNDLASLFRSSPSKGPGANMLGFLYPPGSSPEDGKLLPADLSEMELRFEQGSNLENVYASLITSDGMRIASNQPLQISNISTMEPETLPPAAYSNTGSLCKIRSPNLTICSNRVIYESALLETVNMKEGPNSTEEVPGLVYAEPFWDYSGEINQTVKDPRPITDPQPLTDPPSGYLVVAIPTGDDQKALQQLSSILFTGGIGAILFALLFGLPLARLGLRPLERITDTASQIGAGELTRRVPLPRQAISGTGDEVQQLGQTFNSMLDRIEASFAAQQRSEARTRQFAADASHELRSPITVLGGYIDVLLLGAKDDPEQEERILHSMRRENERLGRLVSDLLLLTRMDANGAANLKREPVAMADIANRACDNMRLVACDRAIILSVQPGAEHIQVNGDGDQLYRVITNLLDNAIRYTPENGAIEVTLASADKGNVVRLSVADSGCGIEAADLAHIFDRFYRADWSRDRQTGNAGLGLAICKSIIEAHGGTIQAESTLGAGAIFVVALPALPSSRIFSADSQRGFSADQA